MLCVPSSRRSWNLRATRVRRGCAVAALTLLILVSGCAPSGSGAGRANRVETATTASPSSAAVTTTSATTATPRGDHQPLKVHTERWIGTVPGFKHNIELPVFDGSGAEAVNRRVRTSARHAVAQSVAQVRSGDDQRTLSGRGRVTTNDGRTVQVRFELDDYLQGTAHPTYYVRTVVVTVPAGKPVTLDHVFPDKNAAFRALAAEVRTLAASDGDGVIDPDGLAPRESNWAAWQTTEKGVAFSFGDYQLGGHGLREYTVPWPAVRPFMSAKAYELLGPES